MTRHPIAIPDLDLPGVPITVSSWLAGLGERVVEGDRVVEILAGDVTVDLESPVSGVLGEKLAAVDEAVRAGQVVGVVLARDTDGA